MSENSTYIERRGIVILEQALLTCPRIEPTIFINNTTPCWDGEIRVYSVSWKKKNLIGRVPVQVKASYQTDLSKDTISFQAEMDDIKRYYDDGGVFFFVVYFNDDNGHCIYYASLLPIDLNPIIKMDKKSHAIQLERFPEGNEEKIMNAFLHFLNNSPRQMSITKYGIKSIVELNRNGVKFESLSFNLPNFEHRDPVDLVFNSDAPIYLYGKPEKLSVEIPIQKVTDCDIIMSIFEPVMVNGIEFYPSYVVTQQCGKPVALIGHSSTIIGFEHGALNYDIQFNVRGTLKQRITDLEFVTALLDNGHITISGKTREINLVNVERESVNNQLRLCNDIKKCWKLLALTGI